MPGEDDANDLGRLARAIQKLAALTCCRERSMMEADPSAQLLLLMDT